MKLIAEIGSNWYYKDPINQLAYISMLVKELDFVDYIKFQFWDTDKFITKHHPGYDTVKKFEFPKELYKDVFNLIGKDRFMVTCFDTDTADMLRNIGNINWKIASGDITYYKLIEHIAKYKDSMFISTGNATPYEIKKAIHKAEEYTSDITIFHCVSKYPTKLSEVGIDHVTRLKKMYPEYKTGISTHTTYPNIKKVCGVVSILGASIAEVHVKLDNNVINTPDSSFSLTVKELRELKKDIDTYNEMLYNINIDEHELIWARRNEKGLRPNL